ncbi:alpha/beta hydrolase [candidate division KSB1 bacterium]
MANRKNTIILNKGVGRWTHIQRLSDINRRSFLKCSMGALAAPILMSCNDSTPTTAPVYSPKLTARPELPSLSPTIGLSRLGLENSRDGILYVPESYSPDTAAPLFVALHGAGGSSSDWESYHARMEARGMILLVPESRSYTWDLVLGSYGPDVNFLDRALQHTFERCRIDPTRLVLGGFSDGASYALSLGLINGDLFSHIVAYSPGFYLQTNAFVGKPKIYISHGTLDNILPVIYSRLSIVPDLRAAGYEVTYNEFEGGHEVPAAVSEAALDWILNVI